MGGREGHSDGPLILDFIEVEGFVSYLHATRFSFNGGVVAVVGANGHGKSTITTKALTWALYGKCAPERMGSGSQALKGADVVCDASRTARVTVGFRKGAQQLVVERTRKRAGGEVVKVEIDGALSTITPDVVIGVGYDVFVRTCVRGQLDPWNFAEATDARKREILDVVSGGEWAAEYHERVKAVHRALSTERDKIAGALVAARRAMPEDPATLAARADAWDRELAERRAKLTAARDKLIAEANEAQVIDASIAAQIAAFPPEPQLDLAPFAAAVAAAQAVTANLAAQQQVATDKLARITALAGHTACPTCGQAVAGHVAEWVTAAQAELTELAGPCEAAIAAQYNAVVQYKHAESWLATERTRWRDARRALDVRPNVAALQAQAAAAEGALRATHVDNPHRAAAAVIAEQAEVAAREIERLEFEQRLNTIDLEYATRWLDVFAPKGLRAYLNEASIAAIEREANRWLAVLSGGRMMVTIRATREVRGAAKEEITLSVLATQAGSTVPRDLLQFSGGERARINLAVDLGVAAAFGGGGQLALSLLVIDENAFSGLDAEGKRSIVEAINEVGVHDVVVIDHDPALTGVFPRTVRAVRGADGYSEIEEA